MPKTSVKNKIAKPMGVCSFCMGDEDKNADGVPEDMIHCAECGNSGHPSCLHYSKKLVEKIKTIRWQCLDCKRCVVCRKGDDSLLFCDLCDAAIHPKCSTPPLHHVPKGEFACQSCREEKKSKKKAKISRPVAQLIDGMSKFFLPKKKTDQQRQQSVQKAMKYLRQNQQNDRSRTLARRILSASKSERVRRKPTDFNETKPIVAARTSSPKKSQSAPTPKRKHEDEPSEDEVKVTKRKLHLDLSKYKNPPSFLHDSLPDSLTNNDVYQFLDARNNSSKLISDCSDQYFVPKEELENNNDPNNIRWPPYIVFGTELIKTWYSSSYPQEYARVPRLFICEFCLKYMKCEEVYDRHREKCQTFHPPANEIYHKDDLSVFEVDGNINRIYCQNLCLLAKLFLDHKTLYYDVEPFLFYVLTRNDAAGCHFLGYFSKEKHCPQKYNLSCIMVLPHCQRRGYGRFLIELSYVLSGKENQLGTPERPLSTHGAHTYEAFWKLKIVRHLLKYHHEKKDTSLLKLLMEETAIAADDIFDTLQNLGMLTMKTNGTLVIQADVQLLESIVANEKMKHGHWVSFDEEFLRFTPVLKPFLFNPDDQFDQANKEFEIVFKEIEPDSTQSTHPPEESADTEKEPVRVGRRRKFGRKRRSMYVKHRVPTKNPPTTIANEDDEHSQEYVSRRRTISTSEPAKEEDENSSSSVSISKCDFAPEPTPTPTPNSKDETNHIPQIEHPPVKRLSNAHISASESDLRTLANGYAVELHSTTLSTNDQPKKTFNSPLPFKKRAWVSANLDALIDLPRNDPHLINGSASPPRMIDDPPNHRPTYSTRSRVAQQQQQQTTIPAHHIQSILDNFGQILPSLSDSTTLK